MKTRILPLEDVKISGVSVHFSRDDNPYKENYFEWNESPLVAEFSSSDISGGSLKAWHHTPVFHEIETHIDKEMFYFVAGTAIMLFADIKNDRPTLESIQMVRIQAGTQIIIDAGKAHFVAVASDDEPVKAIIIAPKMSAQRMRLPEIVEGTDE